VTFSVTRPAGSPTALAGSARSARSRASTAGRPVRRGRGSRGAARAPARGGGSRSSWASHRRRATLVEGGPGARATSGRRVRTRPAHDSPPSRRGLFARTSTASSTASSAARRRRVGRAVLHVLDWSGRSSGL
jgi:hypothetical protein